MKIQHKSCIKLACVLSSVLALSACGGGSSSSSLPGLNQSDFSDIFDNDSDFFDDDEECMPVNASCFLELVGGAGESVNQFDGQWLSGCERLEDFDAQYSEDAAYRVESLIVDGGTGSRTNNYYSDSQCTSPASTSEVASTLAFFYASIFTDNTVGVDNIVLVNIDASNLTFDSAAPSADQEAEITRTRADLTFYTSMQRFGTELFIGKPQGLVDGRNSDDRILSPFSERDSQGENGIQYSQQ